MGLMGLMGLMGRMGGMGQGGTLFPGWAENGGLQEGGKKSIGRSVDDSKQETRAMAERTMKQSR